MPKFSRFAHCGRMLPALSLMCALACAQPALGQNNDPLNPPLTAHINNVPFAAALDMVFRTTNVSFRLPPNLAAQLDPDALVNMDMDNGTLQDGLTALLSQANPPMTFHLENGMYVVGFTGAPRRPTPAKKPKPYPFDIKGRPFEEVVRFMFMAEHARYRIDPAVTAYRDPLTFNADDTTLDTKLGLLLASVPGQKSQLTYRVDKGVYIIALKNAKSSEAGAPVGLPSYNPQPVIKSVVIRDEHPDAALEQMFTQAGVNYAFTLPTGVGATPRMNFAMRDVPLEQAVVHLLRSASVDPMLCLQITRGGEGIEAIEGLQATAGIEARQLAYTVLPDPLALAPASAPVMHHWFGFHKMDLYVAFKALLSGSKMGCTLDSDLHMLDVTVSGSDLTLEKAVSRLLAASPAPLTFSTANNTLEVRLARRQSITVKKRP